MPWAIEFDAFGVDDAVHGTQLDNLASSERK
jgi:hypothetical protein